LFSELTSYPDEKMKRKEQKEDIVNKNIQITAKALEIPTSRNPRLAV